MDKERDCVRVGGVAEKEPLSQLRYVSDCARGPLDGQAGLFSNT